MGQSGVAHPDQLRLDVDKPVLRIIGRPSDASQELRMQHRRGRRDDLQVGEDTAGPELTSDLVDQRPLATVVQVVDGEARNDEVELPERAQVVREIPRPDLDAIVRAEPLTRSIEHGWRPVDGDDPRDGRKRIDHETHQPAVTASQVEHRPRLARQHLQQRRFARESRWQSLHSIQVPVDLIRVVPSGCRRARRLRGRRAVVGMHGTSLA